MPELQQLDLDARSSTLAVVEERVVSPGSARQFRPSVKGGNMLYLCVSGLGGGRQIGV